MSASLPLTPPVRLAAALGARSVLVRLAAEKTWLPALLAVAGTITAALLEREHARFGAADRALSGAAFGVVLPLLAYAVFDASLGHQRLDRTFEPLARHGADTRVVGTGVLAALSAVVALTGVLLASVAVLVARGWSDPLLVRDLASSAWIGALAGLAYAGWLALGSTFGRRGGGRKWALVVDFVLGATSSALALPWPRGHVRNLLGGAPPLDLTQNAALLCLVGMTVLTLSMALWRSAR